MPVIPEPIAPPPSGPGLIYSPPSAPSTVTVTSPDCRWWLVFPERPELSIPLETVRPSAGAGSLPSGDIAWSSDRAVAEGVFHPVGRKHAVVTHGDMQGEELDISVLFVGEDALDAFDNARGLFLTGLVQSDQLGRQWYVDLGNKAPRAVPQLRNRPTLPHYVVALHVIEVDPPKIT